MVRLVRQFFYCVGSSIILAKQLIYRKSLKNLLKRVIPQTYLGSPLEPQLEDVVVAATLDHLIPGVVLHVVQLVLHEQVVRGHLVTAE